MYSEAQPELLDFVWIRSVNFLAGLALLCREMFVLQRKFCQIISRFFVKRDISTAKLCVLS